MAGGSSLDYHVDLAELDAVTSDLRRTQQRMEQRLGELDQLVAGLAAVWRGAAADAQRTAHAAWAKEARDMHRALTELEQSTAVAHGNYSSAVQANVSMWQQVG